MRFMKLPQLRRQSSQTGYTLLTTLILTAAATALLAATLSRSTTVEKLNDHDNAYQVANAAAEAATEKVLSRMAVDFANGGELALSNNLTSYQSNMLPNSTESSFWSNFVFSDGQGNNNRIYVTRKTGTPNPPYVQLLQQYPGLNAFAATYRVLANTSYASGNYPGLVGACQQDLQMAEIPVFQFALFYNTIMEFSDCAPFTINGRVHCNTNIDVGTISSSSLTFNYFVTCSGTISNPPMAGYAQSSWTGPITYNGTPVPGYGTGEPVLTLPVGTNNTPTGVREIIKEPLAGEAITNPISPQRFFNKAYVVIILTNAVLGTGTNAVGASNYSVLISIKNSMYDAAPTNIYLGTNIALNTNALNWSNSGVSNWLSTNVVFYDQREGRTNHVTQIDILKLGQWLNNTNTNTYSTNYNTKWSGVVGFNGIIYVDDNRDTNSAWMNCVRVINGQNITNGLYSTGLTLATENPLYIEGLYNCPSAANVGSTNTIGCRPCSFVCDAITILSPNWQSSGYDAFSSSGPGKSYTGRTAAADTVNAAIIAGNVLSTDATSTGFSGGVMNLPRLLEAWSGITLTLNTSIINLYNSVQAAQQFQMPSIYYSAPSRQFSFDLNFTTATGLPPGTPLVDRMIRGTWCNPPPNNVNYSWTNDFVAR